MNYWCSDPQFVYNLVPIQIIHHEEDPDVGSDDEGLRFGGLFGAETGNPLASVINITSGREPPAVFLSRRSRSGKDQRQSLYFLLIRAL